MDEWIERDLECIWHPYTQMKDCKTLPPILIERAQGVRLYDSKGGLYYDTISSWWCNVHGHNHPKIKEAIKDQLDSLEHILFAGFTHRPAIQLAEALVAKTPPNLKKVFFSDNGSTAVEVAIKLSFQYWQNIGNYKKRVFISLEDAYHGDTIGAMSVSGLRLFNKIFDPLLFSSIKIPSPNCRRCPIKKRRDLCKIDCLGILEDILKKDSQRIAAIIIEPLLLAAGGMIVYPKEYLEGVGRLVSEYGVHLIVDEVATGFGRCGKMFAIEYTNIKPDFMCLSKGITGGYLPLGATLTTDEVYYAFYDDYTKNKTFYHGHTYTANPLACRAAISSLEVFEEERVLERISKIIPVFHKEMERFRDISIVEDVRYIGMIGAIELHSVDDKRLGYMVYKEGLKEGLILRPLVNVIYLFLPLCIRLNELEEITSRTYKVIEKVCKG